MRLEEQEEELVKVDNKEKIKTLEEVEEKVRNSIATALPGG